MQVYFPDSYSSLTKAHQSSLALQRKAAAKYVNQDCLFVIPSLFFFLKNHRAIKLATERFIRSASHFYANVGCWLSKRGKKIGANYVRLFGLIMCRCVDVFDVFVVSVVFHQNSVLVAFRVTAVVVLLDFIGQVIGIRSVEVSNGVVAVLPFVLYHWKQTPGPSVLKRMKSVLSSSGITQSHHVVIQAVLNVPHQQLEAMARRWLTEPAVLQLFVRVEGLQT